MQSFELEYNGARITVHRDDDGAFIIPDDLRGLGTALKPAAEPWILIRKPIEKKLSIAENVLKWGTGAVNVDGCRVGASARDTENARVPQPSFGSETGAVYGMRCGEGRNGQTFDMSAGRFPPNFVLTHDARCRRIGSREVKANPTWDTPNRNTAPSAFTGSEVSPVRHANGRDGESSAERRYNHDSADFSPLPGKRRDEAETVPVYECHPSCPVAELDTQSGELRSGGLTLGGTQRVHGACYNEIESNGSNASGANSVGGASRYFPQFEWDPELDTIPSFTYAAKPSRAEKELGLDHFRARSGGEATERKDGSDGTRSPRAGAGRTGGAKNVHATVKGHKLLCYLTRFVTPPRGIVLDIFAGSGSGGVSAIREGFRWIGAEQLDTDEKPFITIARARITYVFGGLYVPRESLRAPKPPVQTSLFEVSNG